MGKFGWSYPPGAENDPNAPWNQTDDYAQCPKCDGYGYIYDNPSCVCDLCNGEGEVLEEDLTDWDRADDIRDAKLDES